MGVRVEMSRIHHSHAGTCTESTKILRIIKLGYSKDKKLTRNMTRSGKETKYMHFTKILGMQYFSQHKN